MAYRIYRGKDRDDLELIATVDKTGFETTYEFETNEQVLWYFQVIPVDGKGASGQPSRVVPRAVNGDTVYIPMIGMTNGG